MSTQDRPRDPFGVVLGARRGDPHDPRRAVNELLHAVTALPAATLAAFRHAPMRADDATVTLAAMGRHRDRDLPADCESAIARHPALRMPEHRAVIDALLDGVYAHIARPHLPAATYAAGLASITALLAS